MSRIMELRVKYIRDVEPIERIDGGDWIDLRAAEDFDLEPFDFCKIPLGIAMELPDGFEAIVAPRSSTFDKWGLLMVNGIGIIDQTYCGDSDEWQFPALATKKVHIYKNDRICQFRILYHQPNFEIKMVDSLGNPDRGGFGSTGTR